MASWLLATAAAGWPVAAGLGLVGWSRARRAIRARAQALTTREAAGHEGAGVANPFPIEAAAVAEDAAIPAPEDSPAASRDATAA